MSIKMLAQELYRLEKEVEALQRKISQAAPEERDRLELELRKVKAVRDDYRGRLQAKKEPPPYRTGFR